MQEAEAITRLKRGDIGGLGVLVRTYQLPAIRAARLVTHDPALAEDIVQAAFVRAYERIDQFDSRRPFGPWFLRSVVNDAVKAANRRARLASLDEPCDSPGVQALGEWLAAPDPGPEELTLRAELREELRQALLQLSPAERATVALRYYLGLSEREVADELEIPCGTVKSRLHAARERLRRRLRRVDPRLQAPDPSQSERGGS